MGMWLVLCLRGGRNGRPSKNCDSALTAGNLSLTKRRLSEDTRVTTIALGVRAVSARLRPRPLSFLLVLNEQRMVSAKLIASETDLIALVGRLGFLADSPDHLRLPVRSEIPACCIFPTANQTLKPVAISVEDGKFCIYFYNELNDWFNLFSRFDGDISESNLREAILDGSKGATLESQ